MVCFAKPTYVFLCKYLLHQPHKPQKEMKNMKMKHTRIEQIYGGINNKAFGDNTPMVEMLLEQALYEANGDYQSRKAKPFWDAVIALVKALKPEMFSPNRIPRQIMSVIDDIYSIVLEKEGMHLYRMKEELGFLPFLPRGRSWLYDRDCEGLNAQAHVDHIALTRANHTRNMLIKAFRSGAWDGSHDTINTVFSTGIMRGCYGPEDCR